MSVTAVLFDSERGMIFGTRLAGASVTITATLLSVGRSTVSTGNVSIFEIQKKT